MTISNNNTRTNLTISKDLKARLETMAKDQNRSFNNLVINVLTNYIKLQESRNNKTIK